MEPLPASITLSKNEALDLVAWLDDAIDILALSEEYQAAAKVSSARAIVFHKLFGEGPVGSQV